jgi:hypothetical protein
MTNIADSESGRAVTYPLTTDTAEVVRFDPQVATMKTSTDAQPPSSGFHTNHYGKIPGT